MKYFSKYSLILLFAVFMFASSAMAIDRYVATGGNNSNDGSAGSPWLTIQHAIDNSVAGDVINVAAGTYTEDLLIDKSLTLLGELDGTTRLTTIKGIATEPVANWPLATENIDIAANDVTISNFIIATPTIADGRYSSGIVLNGTGIEISNNEFVADGNESHDSRAVFIQSRRVDALPGSVSNGLLIQNNIFGGTIGTRGYYGFFSNRTSDDGAGDMVQIVGNQFSGRMRAAIANERSRIIIENNVIQSSGFATESINGIWIIDWDVTRNITDVTISGNTISDLAGTGVTLGLETAGPTYQTLTNILVEENDISGNNKGILVSSGAGGVTILNNDIYDNTTNGVENTHTAELNAKFNWWGSTSGPGGEGPGTGDDVSVNVLYAPWLGAEQGTEPAPGEPKYYVDETGDIQDAIDAAVAGDIIEIGDGVFNQTITVNKANLTIKNGSEPIFDGGGAGIGFDVLANDFTLEGVTVRNFLSGIRVAIGVTGTTINECKIYSNTNYGVENLGTEAVDATLNWWGHLSGPFHSSNTCGSGNAVTDNVTYSPWYNSVLMNSTTVLDLTPTTQARFIGFTNVTDTEMTVAWLSGNGVQRLVVIRADNSFGDTDTWLGANTINVSTVDGTLGNAAAIGATGSSVIALTDINYVNLSGLTAETTYWIKVYEVGCLASGVAQEIYTPNSTLNPRSRKTLPGSPPTPIAASYITANSFYANWTFAGAPLGANDWIEIGISDGSTEDIFDIGNDFTGGNTFPMVYHSNNVLLENTTYTIRIRVVRNNVPGTWSTTWDVTTFTDDMAIYYDVPPTAPLVASTWCDSQTADLEVNDILNWTVTLAALDAYAWSVTGGTVGYVNDDSVEPTATFTNAGAAPTTPTVKVVLTDEDGNWGELEAQITINPAGQAPTITQTAPKVCEDGLILLSFSDGVGDYVRWEYSSDDANWFELTTVASLGGIFNLGTGNEVSFDGSNFLTIDNATALIHNLYFRVVFDDACSVEDESASVQMSFFATTVARNIIADDLSIDLCESENVSIQPEAAIPVGEYVRWEYSVDGLIPWYDVEDAVDGLVAQGYVTSLVIQSGGATTYRRLDLTEVDNSADGLNLRIVYVNGPCDEDVSDAPAVLNVSPTPLLGFSFNAVLADTDDHFYYCEDEALSITLSHVWAGTGPFNIAWEVREDNSAGTLIPALSGSGTFSATDALFGPLTLDPGTYYVAITSIEDAATGCTFDLSGVNPYVAYVTVRETPFVVFTFNDEAAAPGSTFDFCETSNLSVKIEDLYGLKKGVEPYTISWNVRQNNNLGAIIPELSGTGSNFGLGLGLVDVLFNEPVAPGVYYIEVTELSDEYCSFPTPTGTFYATVEVHEEPLAKSIAEVDLEQTTCEFVESISFNLVADAPTPVGTFDSWYYSTDGINWLIIDGTSPFDGTWADVITNNEFVLTLDDISSALDEYYFTPFWENGPCEMASSPTAAQLFVDPVSVAGTVNTVNATVCENGTFEATLGGTPTGDFLGWFKWVAGNWVAVDTDDADISVDGQTNALTIANLELTDAGDYTAGWQSGVCDVAYATAITLTVNPLPAIGFSFNGTLAGTASPFEYCEDETITVTLSHIWSGTAPFSVTYQVNEETPVTVNNLTLVPTDDVLFSGTMVPGTYTITMTNITDANGCSPTDYAPYTATVTVNPTPEATYALNGNSVGPFNYCVGDDIILSLASIVDGTGPFNVGWSIESTSPVFSSSGTANNVAALGTITNTTSLAAGTYTFTVTSLEDTETGCEATGTLQEFTVNVYAVPTVSAPTGGPFCAETDAVLTAANTNATLFQWEVADLEAGPFTPISSIDTDYSGQTTDELTVLWDGGSKSEKWYRLSASNAGFCLVYGAPAQLLYTPLPDFANNQPANQTACDAGPAEFTSTPTYATSYQWQILDGSWTDLVNDAIYSDVTTTTLSISDVTGLDGEEYRLVAWNDGCPVDGTPSTAATLTVTPLPSFTSYIEDTNPICESASVTFTANFTNWTLITWERRVDDQSSWVEVTQNLDLGVYSFNIDGTQLTINPPQGLNGYEYRAIAYNEGCPTEGVAGDIIVLEVRNNTVARTVVEEEQSICETDGVTFTLEGTAVGTFVTWQYSPNEGTNWFQIDNAVAPFTGLVVTENGTELELQNVPFAFDGYWFRAQYQNSPCNAASSANYGVLLVGTYPLAYTVTIVDEEICSGNETSVDLSDSEEGVEYQLFNGLTEVGDPQEGTGNGLSWTVDETGTYTIVGYNAGCETTMTGSVSLTVNLVPQVSGLPTENEIFVCEGTELSISGLTDDAGTYSYDWTTTAINGYTSSFLNPGVINATADADDAGVYTLVVTNDDTGCETTIDITVTVLAEPETPVLADILVSDTDSETGDDYSTYCELDAPTTLYLHIDNAGGYGVEWATDNQFTNIIGTNNPQSYTAPTDAGTTTLYVRRTTEDCGDSEYLAFDITVNETPAVLFSFNGVNASTGSEFEYCEGTQLTVLLDSDISGSGIYNVNYNVYVDGSVTPDGTLSGSATDLEAEGTLFNSTLAPGEYLIEVTMLEDDVTGCTFPNPADTYTATVTIIANPWATITVDEESCTGVYVEFDLEAGGGTGWWTVNYLQNGNGPYSNSVPPGGHNISIQPALPGDITIEIISVVNDEGCVTTYAEGNRPTATVSILQTPAQPGAISGETTVEQDAGALVYSITPVSGATGYTWGWSGDAPANVTITGSGVSRTLNFPANAEIGEWVLFVYASNGICDGPVQTLGIEIIPEAAPTKLRFVGVPTEDQESGVPFQVQIQAVDDGDVVRKVTNLTQFQITLQNGDGSFLSVSSSIAAGNSISSPINITYTLDDAVDDEDDVRFLVTRTSGDLLASGISHPDEEGEGLYYKRGAPTVQAKNIIFTSWNRSRINFSWTKGNGVYTLAVVKLGNNATLTAPTDGESYSTNVSINLAQDIGGGTKANYAGTGTASYASGLSSNTYYTFGVYSYNFVDPDELYNTSSATNNPRSAKTNSKEAEDSFTFFLGEFAVSEVYPNPAQTEINFSVESVNDLPFNIELFNMLGERVYADHKFLSQGTYNFSIPVHNEIGGLPAGSYMLRISAGGETHSTSVIISR